MTIHCMLDLETLGNNCDAAIVQIGACVFDEKVIKDEICLNIDFNSALQTGSVTGSTLQWWMQQDDAAIKSLAKECYRQPVLGALNGFSLWLSQHDIDNFWAHATFDFPVLTNQYKVHGMRTPYPYWKCRDLRTIKFLVGDIDLPEREGTHHDARDDAIYQAKCLQVMLAHND